MVKEFRCKQTVYRSYEVYVVADDEEQAERKADAIPRTEWTETTDERSPDHDIEVEDA